MNTYEEINSSAPGRAVEIMREAREKSMQEAGDERLVSLVGRIAAEEFPRVTITFHGETARYNVSDGFTPDPQLTLSPEYSKAVCKTFLKSLGDTVNLACLLRSMKESAAALVCRARPSPLSSAAVGGDMPSEILWMPAGSHFLTAGLSGGGAFAGGVICDESAFEAVNASFKEMAAKGESIFLDFNHDDRTQAALVTAFSWDPDRGIIAQVDWTSLGERAVRSRTYTSFSPAFVASTKTGRVCGLIEGKAAGGLVNEPAFQSDMPLLSV